MRSSRGMIALLALVFGCSSQAGYKSQEWTLGPWRTLLNGPPVCAIASCETDREHVLVATKDSLALIRLRDGAIERRKEMALPFEPTAIVPILWSGDRIMIGCGSKLIILNKWELEEERPIPQSDEAKLVENPKTGELYLTTPDGLFVWDRGPRSWKSVTNRYQVLHSQPFASPQGAIVTMRGVLRDDGEYRPFRQEPFQITGAWRSIEDPRFILAAAYPAPAVSRDGGDTWDRSTTEIYGERHCAGFDAGSGHMLFVESHDGKMGLGQLHGPSELWVSRDDGRAFKREQVLERACTGMVVVGRTLVISFQSNLVVAAEIIPRTPR